MGAIGTVRISCCTGPPEPEFPGLLKRLQIWAQATKAGGIDSWAPLKFKNTVSVHAVYVQYCTIKTIFFFPSPFLPAGRIYNAGTLHSEGGCRIRSRQKVCLSALIKGKFHKNLAWSVIWSLDVPDSREVGIHCAGHSDRCSWRRWPREDITSMERNKITVSCGEEENFH